METSMNSPDEFQLSTEAAEAYESRFVPSLFAIWAPHVVRAAGVGSGQSVLDVGCGTGIVARTAAASMGGAGRVVGVDINEGMLAVARRVAPDIEWEFADAAALPFPDHIFDVVLCQAALMFVPEPLRALREMGRVAAPEGTVVIQVWGARDSQPGYTPFYDVVRRYAGPDSIDLVSSYWRLGDLGALIELCRAAGLSADKVQTLTEIARYSSVEEFVTTEVLGTPLEQRINTDAMAGMVAEAEQALAQYQTPDSLDLPITGHILTCHSVPS